MKKNWTMRVGALMLVLTLITSCFVGGTFAKYVTSGTATDSARVAKFGVTVKATNEAFHKTYAKDDTTFTGTNTVESEVNVVAPGTKGNMVAFAIEGTPEVAVRVAYTVPENGIELKNWEVAAPTAEDENATEYYCPLVVKVGTTELYGMDYNNADEFAAAIKTAIEAHTKDYAANADLSVAATTDLPAISWSWAFEAGEDANKENDDVKDTYLGDVAAENVDNAATIKIAVETSVTQID